MVVLTLSNKQEFIVKQFQSGGYDYTEGGTATYVGSGFWFETVAKDTPNIKGAHLMETFYKKPTLYLWAVPMKYVIKIENKIDKVD